MSDSTDIYKLFDNFIDLKTTPIYNLLMKFEELWNQVRQGRYKTFLGYIDWETHNFDTHPLAVSIMTADESLLRPENGLTVNMELMCRMPQPRRKDGVAGLEPLISAAMKADIQWVMARMREARYPPTKDGTEDNIVLHIVEASGLAADISDMTRKLQGVTFTVEMVI